MKTVKTLVAIAKKAKLIPVAATFLAITALAGADTPAAAPDLGATSSNSTAAKSISMIGLWTVRINNLENKTIKISFERDGGFKFSCIGAKSEGTYKVHDGVITLYYLTVDGQPVDFEMKKNLPLALDGTFEVDRYHYERASNVTAL